MTRVPSGSYRKMSDVFKPPRMTCEPTGPPLKLNVNLPTRRRTPFVFARSDASNVGIPMHVGRLL